MVDDGEAIGLLDSKEVPESGLLLGQVVNIIVIFMQGLDTLQQGHRIAEAFLPSLDLGELLEEASPQLEVEIVGYLGAIDWRNLHKNNNDHTRKGGHIRGTFGAGLPDFDEGSVEPSTSWC